MVKIISISQKKTHSPKQKGDNVAVAQGNIVATINKIEDSVENQKRIHDALTDINGFTRGEFYDRNLHPQTKSIVSKVILKRKNISPNTLQFYWDKIFIPEMAQSEFKSSFPSETLQSIVLSPKCTRSIVDYFVKKLDSLEGYNDEYVSNCLGEGDLSFVEAISRHHDLPEKTIDTFAKTLRHVATDINDNFNENEIENIIEQMIVYNPGIPAKTRAKFMVDSGIPTPLQQEAFSMEVFDWIIRIRGIATREPWGLIEKFVNSNQASPESMEIISRIRRDVNEAYKDNPEHQAFLGDVANKYISDIEQMLLSKVENIEKDAPPWALEVLKNIPPSNFNAIKSPELMAQYVHYVMEKRRGGKKTEDFKNTNEPETIESIRSKVMESLKNNEESLPKQKETEENDTIDDNKKMKFFGE
jgi:hypothetical protein